MNEGFRKTKRNLFVKKKNFSYMSENKYLTD